MIQLTTILSSPLIELIKAGEAPIDAIEVGRWASVPQVIQFQRQFPGWKYYFHSGNVIPVMGLIPSNEKKTKSLLAFHPKPVDLMPYITSSAWLYKLGTAFWVVFAAS